MWTSQCTLSPCENYGSPLILRGGLFPKVDRWWWWLLFVVCRVRQLSARSTRRRAQRCPRRTSRRRRRARRPRTRRRTRTSDTQVKRHLGSRPLKYHKLAAVSLTFTVPGSMRTRKECWKVIRPQVYRFCVVHVYARSECWSCMMIKHHSLGVLKSMYLFQDKFFWSLNNSLRIDMSTNFNRQWSFVSWEVKKGNQATVNISV